MTQQVRQGPQPIDRAATLFKDEDTAELGPCERCGQPTTGRFCAFCRARAQILGERLGSPADDDRQVATELSEEVMPAELYGDPAPTRS